MTDPESLEPRAEAPEQPSEESLQPSLPEPPEETPFWSWLDFVMLVCLALPLLVVTSVAAYPLALWFPRVKALFPVVQIALFYLLWFLALYVVIRTRYDRPFWISLAWFTPPGGLASSAGWGFLVAFGGAALAVALHPPKVETQFQGLLQDPVSLILVGVVGVTIAPMCEELAFRGFLLPLLVRAVGPVGGVLLSAAPFAVLHGFQYAWIWQSLVVIFLAGAAFGWMRLRTGSTAASAVMHCSYNLVLFSGVLYDKRALFH